MIFYGFFYGLGGCATAMGAGGASAIANCAFAFIPMFGAPIIVFALSYLLFSIYFNGNLDFANKLYGWVGARMPVFYLSISIFALLVLMPVVRGVLVYGLGLAAMGIGGSTGNFLAYYTPVQLATGGSSSALTGGVAYLLLNSFPISYPASLGGIGGWLTYMNYMLVHSSQLYLPGGGAIAVPERVHAVVFALSSLAILLLTAAAWIWLVSKRIDNGILKHRRAILLQSVALWAIYVIETVGFAELLGGISAAFLAYFVYTIIKANPRTR